MRAYLPRAYAPVVDVYDRLAERVINYVDSRMYMRACASILCTVRIELFQREKES